MHHLLFNPIDRSFIGDDHFDRFFSGRSSSKRGGTLGGGAERGKNNLLTARELQRHRTLDHGRGVLVHANVYLIQLEQSELVLTASYDRRRPDPLFDRTDDIRYFVNVKRRRCNPCRKTQQSENRENDKFCLVHQH